MIDNLSSVIGIQHGEAEQSFGDPQKNLLIDNQSPVIDIQHGEAEQSFGVNRTAPLLPNLPSPDLDTSLGIQRGAPHNPLTDHHSPVIGIQHEGVEQACGIHRNASSRAALGIQRQPTPADEPQLPVGFESMSEHPLDVTNLHFQEAHPLSSASPPPSSDQSSTGVQTGLLDPLSLAEIARTNYYRPTDNTSPNPKPNPKSPYRFRSYRSRYPTYLGLPVQGDAPVSPASVVAVSVCPDQTASFGFSGTIAHPQCVARKERRCRCPRDPASRSRRSLSPARGRMECSSAAP